MRPSGSEPGKASVLFANARTATDMFRSLIGFLSLSSASWLVKDW